MPPEVVDEIKLWGRDAILGRFRVTLGHLRVPFDVWTSEASLYDGGPAHRGFAGEVGKALRELDGDGELFDADGAVWLRTTDYGDDKDRVLIRQTGAPTYFLSDIAYHRDKMDRGFEHLIDIWGADHHGYVPRMKAMFTALPPHDPDRLELIIGQLVNLLESGVARRMSKRRGDIVTVDDLIEAIGVDAVRFFMVARSHDSTLDLDLDLAVEQSSKNPVYYVQYAHARICSVLRNLPRRAGTAASEPAAARLRRGGGRALRAQPGAHAGAVSAGRARSRRAARAAPGARLPRRARRRVPRVLPQLPGAHRRARGGGLSHRPVRGDPHDPGQGSRAARE